MDPPYNTNSGIFQHHHQQQQYKKPFCHMAVLCLSAGSGGSVVRVLTSRMTCWQSVCVRHSNSSLFLGLKWSSAVSKVILLFGEDDNLYLRRGSFFVPHSSWQAVGKSKITAFSLQSCDSSFISVFIFTPFHIAHLRQDTLCFGIV